MGLPARHRRRLPAILAAWALLGGGGTRAWAEEKAPEFVPDARQDLGALTQQVARRSASLQGELLAVDLARTEAQQSRLLGNPTLDATWGTIPIGPSNPRDLPSPLLNVPNYGIGLSYTFPIGKRGPRRRRGEALLEGSRASYEATARGQAIDFARVLGALATSNMRLEGLKGLLEEGRGTIGLAQARLATGFGTGLDIDRLEIDLSRIEQQLFANEGESRTAQANCANFVGVACRPFADGAGAKAFLAAWIARAREASGPIEDRADLRALEAQGRAAEAESEWARAQSIPDPTIRLGYTYDRFQVSGNQQHSLMLSVSLPLPIFDTGRVQVQAAEARRLRASSQRTQLLTAGQARVAALRRLLEVQIRRQEAITGKLLPRARAVLGDLEKAANNRLIPFVEVIAARRTVNELLLDEADSYGDGFQAAVELLAVQADAPGVRAALTPPPTSTEPAGPSGTPGAE
jgi:cobalt-zinc-cadmium efflux system outer membrane protein